MATPTTYTNLITWFSNTYPKLDWKELSSNRRENYRTEYQTWVTGLSAPAATTTTPATTSTTPTYTGLSPEQITYAQEHYPGVNIGMTPGYNPATSSWADYIKLLKAGGYPTAGLIEPGTTAPTTTPTPTLPTFGAGAAAGIPTPTITPAPAVTPPPIFEAAQVTPAPAYEISPAQQAFEEMLGGKITDWVEAGGYGIPEETQALMIQKQTDTLKARETENIRVMRNNMERRGITNSGFVFANEQAIRSNTTVAIAGAIADVQINSALMKMASFEKAMGATAQFLGYLSEQSQLKYAPKFATWTAQNAADFAAWQANTGGTLEQWKMQEGNKFATWQAEQLATMQVWQGKLDVYKMELNQAYQTQNINLQGYWNQKLQDDQQAMDLQLAEMEIEANQQAAQAQGIGSLFGTILGFIFGK